MPVDPLQKQARLSLPPGLRDAFTHLAGWFEDETRWTRQEKRGAELLQNAASLVPVWRELQSKGVVNTQDWCDLVVRVLLQAYAFPEKWLDEFCLAEQAKANAAAVHAAAVELHGLLSYVPREGEPGYQEMQCELAESGDVWSVLEKLESAFPEVPADPDIEFVLSKWPYTRFMRSVCVGWRKAQVDGTQDLPDLTAVHLVAFVRVLFSSDVAHIEAETLVRSARRMVQDYWES